MTIYTFPRVRVQQRRQGRCPVCGRLATRTRWFEQPANPWSLMEAGEIDALVRAEAAAWVVSDFTHVKCGNK